MNRDKLTLMAKAVYNVLDLETKESSLNDMFEFLELKQSDLKPYDAQTNRESEILKYFFNDEELVCAKEIWAHVEENCEGIGGGDAFVITSDGIMFEIDELNGQYFNYTTDNGDESLTLEYFVLKDGTELMLITLEQYMGRDNSPDLIMKKRDLNKVLFD